MKVAVIGGGINGVMSAWALARRGATVDLFEKGKLMAATSRASSKMLHGGLRYLEHGHFRLVQEALHERAWWIQQAPQFARPLEILVPAYRNQGRPSWQLGLGIKLYEMFAADSGLPIGRGYSAAEVAAVFPNIRTVGLKRAYSYWDGLMDDYALGHWAADRAREVGVRIHEDTEVSKVDAANGGIFLANNRLNFDRIINAAGPWVDQLLASSAQISSYRLDLVRGSHLVLPGRIERGCVLQVPGERRIVFVLPHGDNTLFGTTEVRQQGPDTKGVTADEIDYLLAVWKQFFVDDIGRDAIIDAFSGVRPIVAARRNHSIASRESTIERQGKLINIFGGKWTTARALADKVATATLN